MENKILEQLLNEVKAINTKVDRLETKTDKLEGSVSKLEDDMRFVRITQENKVLPQLQLLFEGQGTIQKQIKNISVIGEMQDDISTLKSAIRYLTQELESLKSAK